MDTPFDGATTRSRSQNQEATQTFRGSVDPAPTRERDQPVADTGHGKGGQGGSASKGGPSDRGGSPSESEFTDPPSDLEGRIDESRRSGDRLESQIQEAQRQKQLAVESRIVELELQERRKELLERELRELLYEPAPRGARKRQRSGSGEQGRARGARDDAGSATGESAVGHARGSHKPPRFQNLPVFQGKSLREAQAFVAGADRRFRIDAGSQYATNQNKIDYCALAFGPGPAAKWERHERREGLGNTTWKEFKEWMMDSIIDPSNRTFDAITSYNTAKQGETQSAEDFAAYLDTLELELRIDDEELRRNNLYAKLREEVQKDILQRDDVPRTRQGMLALATRIENTHRLTDRRSDRRRGDGSVRGNRPTQTNNEEQGQGTRAPPRPRRSDRREDAPTRNPATSPNRTPPRGKPDRRGNGCHGCNSSEHRLAQCPEAVCYNCNKKGHISPDCPSLTGKGESRR